MSESASEMAEHDDGAIVTLRAHAKLTSTLRIVGVRDDGYHLIDAEMVSLELHDVLRIDPTGSGIAAVGPFADGVPLDDTNLVARALDLVGRRARITTDKRVPHGGGLGGGSTDAAAVLRWAGFGVGPDDLATASKLGADIPFCLVGGRAQVEGIGEIVTPRHHVERAVTLVIPPLRVSTPAVYRAWNELDGPAGDGVNDLEPAAIAVEPDLAWWRDAIGDRVSVAPTLAGSGATWFVDGDHTEVLADLARHGATLVATRTVDAQRAGYLRR